MPARKATHQHTYARKTHTRRRETTTNLAAHDTQRTPTGRLGHRPANTCPRETRPHLRHLRVLRLAYPIGIVWLVSSCGVCRAGSTQEEMSPSHNSQATSLTYVRNNCAHNTISTAATPSNMSIYVMQARRLRTQQNLSHRRYKKFVQKQSRAHGVDAASRRLERRRRVTQNPHKLRRRLFHPV